MKLRTALLGAVTAALVAIPAIAHAAWGFTTGNVNMRAGPGTGYSRITTLPAGAQVFVGQKVNGWYQVTYNGQSGFVSGNYISTRGAPPNVRPVPPPPPAFVPPPPPPRWGGPGPRPPHWGGPGPRPPQWGNRPPPPRSGYWRKPTWDQRHGAWYDGRRWYHNGVWYSSPNFSFGFSIGN